MDLLSLLEDNSDTDDCDNQLNLNFLPSSLAINLIYIILLVYVAGFQQPILLNIANQYCCHV